MLFWLWALAMAIGFAAVCISCENADYKRREREREVMDILRRR